MSSDVRNDAGPDLDEASRVAGPDDVWGPEDLDLPEDAADDVTGGATGGMIGDGGYSGGNFGDGG